MPRRLQDVIFLKRLQSVFERENGCPDGLETKQEELCMICTSLGSVTNRPYRLSAMSVGDTISRALPDVRDGLKPVQRRTLNDMYELGIRYDRPFMRPCRPYHLEIPWVNINGGH